MLKINPINLMQVGSGTLKVCQLFGWPGLKDVDRELKPREVRGATDHKAGLKITHDNAAREWVSLVHKL